MEGGDNGDKVIALFPFANDFFFFIHFRFLRLCPDYYSLWHEYGKQSRWILYVGLFTKNNAKYVETAKNNRVLHGFLRYYLEQRMFLYETFCPFYLRKTAEKPIVSLLVLLKLDSSLLGNQKCLLCVFIVRVFDQK